MKIENNTGINYDITKNIFYDMKDEILIENLRQRIKFIPLSIDMVELGMKNKNKAKNH